ncbi:YkuS family protein [Acetivibrio sp. MSJd-27]|jgi:hypothetical protein|uniref:YkuS family protein n=1 Tax=Acetivibrio sp. MSJd-27 TaxID=2841523 RepID=UPI0015A9DC00|nr:YkuS family protein [Acetivibrio sp. MSJd-27]MBU5451492.1 YkuS family protein [Acetivibrio sp. MSJd-27]
MVISLSPEIMHLKEPLEDMGFFTVPFSKNDIPVDALLYYDENFISRNGLLMDTQTTQGVLLVNVRNKSIEEIEMILRYRTYSPLIE